ncbi:ABC transporter permease (plasmid) [Paracoccus sp. TK19116]|uniref:ABC transporter permease n=2 Tax=Paracoccus albicereus TaxID=2922394 RepID=A0ABT1MM39_9RHOB|nr:ABC transporter permease [Paracoccus albicereus]
MLRVMALSLVRDRGALVLSFLLPPAIFVIFAAIFSATANDELPLKVALGKGNNVEAWDRFEEVLRAEPSLRIVGATALDPKDVSRQVEQGTVDAGLFIRGETGGDKVPPLLVLTEPGKPLAGGILSGKIRSLITAEMPDMALSTTVLAIEPLIGGLTPAQTERLETATAALATGDRNLDEAQDLVETAFVGPQKRHNAAVTYCAGAVAILFLLFSSMQSAAVLIDERNSGILDRIAVVPRGPEIVVHGKFLFLVAQGVIQASLIFATAAGFYGVDVIGNLGLWLLVTLAASMAAAGLALAAAATCTTKQQAQAVTTFIVLVCSAVGGSMVPRFMMPLWLQDLGRFTPNAWAIEAYQGTLWRGEALTEMLPELGGLLGLAALSTMYAVSVSKRRLRV